MATTQPKSVSAETSESTSSIGGISGNDPQHIDQFIFEHRGYFQGIRPLFIHIRQLEELTQMKKSALYELVKAGLLPKPIKLSASKNRRAAARWFLPDIVMSLEKLAKSGGGETAPSAAEGIVQTPLSRRRSPNEAADRM